MKHSLLRSSLTLMLLVLFTASAWAAAPTISSTSPAINSLNVAATSNITVTFDQSMNNATLIAGNIKVHGNYRGFYSAAFSVSGNTVTINPDSSFKAGEVITVSVTTGVQNASNEPMAAPYVTRFTAVAGEATSAVQAKVDYATVNTPNQVIAADLDNDGDADLVTVHPGGEKIAVLKNNGDATFAAYVQYTTGGYPNGVASGDVDGDGDVDLVTANAFDGTANGNSISILKNNGDGTFATKVDYIAGTGPYGVVAEDVDGDGDIDVVTANVTGDSISVFLNTGTGTYAAKVDYPCGNDPRSIAAADVDNDGDIDVIVGRYTDWKVSVILNNGSGAFTSYAEYSSEGYVWSVAAADLNTDGDVDILSSNVNNGNKMSVFINNGDGTYAAKVDYSTATFPKHLSTGDIDGDGDLDAVVAASSSSVVSVLKNNGNGTFAAKVDSATGSQPSSAILVDLNGIGVLDIAVSNNFGNSVSILKNVPVVEISSTSPAANALTVSPSANITVTFTALMNSATMTSSTVKVFGSISGPKAGAFSFDGASKTMTFNPTTDFLRGENVTVVVTTGVQAIGGSAVSPAKNFSFTIASAGTGEGHFSIDVTGGYFSAYEHDFLSADVDNDGDADLIGQYYNTGFSVSKNNGGSFDAPVNYNFIPHQDAGWGNLRYADMDSDGNGDIVLLQFNYSPNMKIIILKNNGSGVFSLYDSVALSSPWTYSLEVKDFNNDGKPDLAYKHGGTSAYVSFNTPGWSSTSTLTVPSTQSLTSTDVDNDGDVDLIFYGNGSSVYVMKNNGDETFASATTITANNYQDVYFKDVNGDGYDDLLASVGGPKEFAVLLNNGDGTFASPTTYTLSIQPVKFTFGDYNADGSVDIAFSYQNESIVNIAYNNGSGAFSQQLLFPQLAADLAAMDYDNDGDIDLIGSNNANGRVILTNIPVSAPTTDAGSVTFSNNYGSQFKVNWTNGNGTGRIVVMKQGSAVTWTPSDNSTYAANASFGSGSDLGDGSYVVYNGVSTNVTVTNLAVNTTYHVAVYDYNGLSGIEKYKTTTPGTSSELTNSVAGYPFDTTAGNALSYNGGIYTQTLNNITLGSAFSVEAWVKPASIGAMVIMTHGNDYLWLGMDATGKFTGLLYDNNATSDITITGTSTAVANQWYHLTLTGADGAPLKLYVNGVLEATSGNIGTVSTSSDIFYFGGDYNTASFNGHLDEIRLWSDIRTESEIRENMYKTLSGIPANLVNYWQLNASYTDGPNELSADLVGENPMDDYDAFVMVASGAPVGGATINNGSVAASNNGPHTIGNATLSMTDGFDNPVDVYVSELTADPSNYPTGFGSSTGGKYFVINLFGDPGTFSTSLTLTYGPSVITPAQQTDPGTLRLFRRNSNSAGSWTDLGGAIAANSTTGEVTWSGITSFSQFMSVDINDELPPTFTITKANGADWTLEENQDRISDSVWLTREDYGVLFNIKTESGYNSSTSPAGTQWAYGTTDDGVGSLNFGTFYDLRDSMSGSLQNLPGKDVVLHLLSEDIYLDVHFNSWAAGGDGGFSYTRSIKPLEAISDGLVSITSITPTSAQVTGRVYSKDATATAYIVYGTTSNTYTDSVIVSPGTIPIDTIHTVTATMTGLTASTTYYYRISVWNGITFTRSGERNLVPHEVQVWSKNNGTITFTKADNADYTLSANQDRLSENVALTRKESQGIYNILVQTGYNSSSPSGTEWAYGTTDNLSSLTFDTWYNTHNGTPPSMVGQDMVVHLIEDDIYVDLKFTSWTENGGGGGFSYDRGYSPLSTWPTSASNIGYTSATLSGQVYSHGLTGSAYILYGTTNGVFTDSVAATPGSITASTLTTVSATLSSLTEWTTYYYCIAASNTSYYKRSNSQSFQTGSSTIGNALKFDGSNDYVVVNTQDSTLTAPFTIEAWLNPNTTSGTNCFFDTRSPNEYGFDVKLENGTTIHADIGNGSGWLTTNADATYNYSAGTWIHVAYVVTTTGYTIYVNGTQVGTGSYAESTPLLFDMNHIVKIGSQGGGGEFFNGIIEDMRVWNVARTQQQINDNRFLPFTGPQTGLVSNWQFNETSGTTADDFIGIYDGTLTNFNFNETDGWVLSTTPLPVELTSFMATSNRLSAELKWKTAMELNNHGYEIERTMVDGQIAKGKGASSDKNWSKVGFVEGNGTSNVPKEYAFTDKVQKAGKYSYRLKQIDRDGKFAYSQEVEVNIGAVPLVFALEQNYPNPFNPSTTIGFTLEQSSQTTLKIYDIVGREVATLVNEVLEAGVYHQKLFDARNLASGVYFARLVSGSKVQLKKMMLIK